MDENAKILRTTRSIRKLLPNICENNFKQHTDKQTTL